LSLLKAAVLVLALAIAAGCATRRTPAPVVDRRSPQPVVDRRTPPAVAAKPAATISPDFYAVRRGDTLYSIALEHGADYRDLTQWNHLDDPTRLRIGQELRVKPPEPEGQAQVGSARIPGRVESRPLESQTVQRPLEPQAAQRPLEPQAVQRPLEPRILQREAPKPEDSGIIGVVPLPAQFMWPVKGKVLAEFAEPRRKGIDIDGKPGEPILAAAGGRVTYIGTGIPGMGKLVVIKHDNGFITVYAHNRGIMVKEQQAVVRGQKIAELGSTDSERPKLHFQIRKGAAAVDPLLYLPKD
jgi:lipoprotein NlpD